MFHVLMYDYNRVGMTGFIDLMPYIEAPDDLFTDEEGATLAMEIRFPYWFIEGLAGCVGNIWPADLPFFREYHYDPMTQEYLDICTADQLCHMYAYWNYMEGVGDQLYDLESSGEDNEDGHVDGAVYVSGYMACLYLADLEYRVLKGDGAVTFDQKGDVVSISSEKLREGLSGMRDAENRYIYCEAGTKAIKSELLKGHAVSIAYVADLARPGDTPEGKTYLHFSGSDPVVYAQYTYDQTVVNHAVCIIGWDDTFPASGFGDEHQPPADGAWIVRNSWGEDWGMNGYFYLSYYDKNISDVETYEYIYPEKTEDTECPEILQYDYMPPRILSSTLFAEPVYAANIFPIDGDGELKYVSAMTGDPNTEVTVSVYRLQEDASDPEDGILLGRVTERFLYSGYHRIRLPDHLVLRQGERIGITVLESVPVSDGIRYAFVNTSSPGEKAPEELARRHPEGDVSLTRYAVGVVNSGESFVKFSGEDWMDWKDALSVIGNGGNRIYAAYDNLPVKGYLYPLEAE